jgi:hypothetical protein
MAKHERCAGISAVTTAIYGLTVATSVMTLAISGRIVARFGAITKDKF